MISLLTSRLSGQIKAHRARIETGWDLKQRDIGKSENNVMPSSVVEGQGPGVPATNDWIPENSSEREMHQKASPRQAMQFCTALSTATKSA